MITGNLTTSQATNVLLEPSIPTGLKINFDHSPINIDSLFVKKEVDPSADVPYDITATFEQVCEEYGFEAESHKVETSDNYILKMFRIRKKGQTGRGKAVFLQHGLFSDADAWIQWQEKSLAFVLAEQGYDVWMGNNRGNKYSRHNSRISPEKNYAEFFDYSFFELGKYDAPTQIDYVRKMTKQDKISYIGHSQGTSQMFSALSYNHGDLQDKLNVFLALAPIINTANSPNTMIQSASNYWRTIEPALDFFNAYEIKSPSYNQGMNKFCSYIPYICQHISDFLSPCSPWNDAARSKIVNGRPDSSASIKQILHYGQTFETGIYKQFDYGSDKRNTERYGSAIIPLIPLWEIKKVPIAYFVGKHDDLADPVDTEWSYNKIKTAIHYKLYDDMDHFSWQVGKNMEWTKDVLNFVNIFNTQSSEDAIEATKNSLY